MQLTSDPCIGYGMSPAYVMPRKGPILASIVMTLNAPEPRVSIEKLSRGPGFCGVDQDAIFKERFDNKLQFVCNTVALTIASS